VPTRRTLRRVGPGRRGQGERTPDRARSRQPYRRASRTVGHGWYSHSGLGRALQRHPDPGVRQQQLCHRPHGSRTGGRSSSVTSFANRRVSQSGRTGRPLAWTNTRDFGSTRPCRRRCACHNAHRIRTETSSRASTRIPAADLGGPRNSTPSITMTCCRIVNSPATGSMSSHRSPAISPRRGPRSATSHHNTNSRSSCTASRNRGHMA
jgi:hypothetical protein